MIGTHGTLLLAAHTASPRQPAEVCAVRFLSSEESEVAFERLGFRRDRLIENSRAASRLKALRFIYGRPEDFAHDVAIAISEQFVGSSTCLLWTFGANRPCRDPRDLPGYQEWRRAQGEARPLAEAPGHLFQADETDLVVAGIEWAFRSNWNALISASPMAPVIRLYDGDQLTIYCRSRPKRLIARLDALHMLHLE